MKLRSDLHVGQENEPLFCPPPPPPLPPPPPDPFGLAETRDMTPARRIENIEFRILRFRITVLATLGPTIRPLGKLGMSCNGLLVLEK